MPKDAAREREDEVLNLVCTALSDDKRRCAVVGRPDRDLRTRELTVDALLCVAEEDREQLWAADVCLASNKFDPGLPAAMRTLRQMLLPPLTELAVKAGRAVSVTCVAYVRLPGVSRNQWKRITHEHVRNVCDRAVIALCRPDQEYYDTEVGIYWRAFDPNAGYERVMVGFSEPHLHESFRFSRAVSLKLTRQLKRAHEQGYPTLLILDQKAPDYVDWIANSLPEPPVIGEGLAFLVAHHKAKLSAGVLVNNDASVHEVYKRVGTSFRCECKSDGQG
jgi:hypothetical protein